MEKEELTEELQYRIKVFRLLWLTMLAVASGSLGLLVGRVDALVLAATGVAVFLALGGEIVTMSR